MKVTIYDKVAWPGFIQWCLKTSWLLGCLFQKMVGAVDAYYGAESWEDAKTWLMKQKTPITEIQYWGHGSPGVIWLAGQQVPRDEWLSLKSILSKDSLIWFRVCESFQGKQGYLFSKTLADNLGCTIAGHTYVIGLWQSGLHTRIPNSDPSWNINEGKEKSSIPDYLQFWRQNTIFCLKTSIPKGW